VKTTGFEIDSYLTGGDPIAVVGRETLRVLRSSETHPGSDWVTIFTFRGPAGPA
jgi:hypothetical protein